MTLFISALLALLAVPAAWARWLASHEMEQRAWFEMPQADYERVCNELYDAAQRPAVSP